MHQRDNQLFNSTLLDVSGSSASKFCSVKTVALFTLAVFSSSSALAERISAPAPLAPFAGSQMEQPSQQATGRRIDVIPLAAAPTDATGSLSQEFVRGYILVQPRAGLPRTALDNALSAHGGEVLGQLENINVYVVSLPPTASERAVAHALSQHPHIKFAEPDALMRADFVPNDTYYPSEWHLQTIDAPSAWNLANGSGVVVAILDSGIDSTHPDLGSQVVPGWNFWDNNSNTADVYGHGTKVAGVVSASGNNGMGVAGIAYGARLMPIRVTDTSGYASASALASGLTYAADHGARVANISFAVQSSSTVLSAAQYFTNKGGVVMNSAGNSGVLDSTPASGSLVSVAATDGTDARASFSTYGPYVDISAPGVGIWTTTMGGGYGGVSGTSFSSPLAAGVAAVMMSANSKLSPTQIVSMLESTSTDLGGAGYDTFYGFGRVSAGRAVAAAAAGAPSDAQAPGVVIASPSGGPVSGIVNANVNATDNVGVSRVELLVNGAVIATDSAAPYSFSWDSTAFVGTNATLTARAYDAAGNVGSSAPVAVNVASAVTTDTIPPTVSIASPFGTVTGLVSVSMNATDNVGVTRVELLVNGAVVGSDVASPYSISWDSSSLVGTVATLMARAYDAAGNAGASSTLSVTVASGTPPSNPDTTPPIVTISSPANGSKVSGNVAFSVSAKDNMQVATVTLSIDGATVATSNSGSMTYRWNSRKYASGSHTLTAVARDTSGNQTSTSISVSN